MSTAAEEIKAHLHLQWGQLKKLGLRQFASWHLGMADAWLKDAGQRAELPQITDEEIRRSRRSDTVYVFGSGYSLCEMTAPEWEAISRHDTLGFSGFIYAPWVRVDYQLVRGWVETQVGRKGWEAYTRDFVETMESNPRFRETILVLQGGYMAQFCNALVGYRLLRPGTRLFRFKSRRVHGLPTRSFAEGLRHNAGTLSDAVNFAVCGGWKRIVLVGVDLYDNRYFWLGPNETLGMDPVTRRLIPVAVTVHGHRHDQTHNTVRNGIVESLAEWREDLRRDGVEIEVYNPRSLLAAALPVHGRESEPNAAASDELPTTFANSEPASAGADRTPAKPAADMIP